MYHSSLNNTLENNEKTITIKKLLLSLNVVLFITIIFSGSTVIATYKNELLLLSAGICVVTFVISNLKFRLLNSISLIWMFVICYMFIGAFNSYNPSYSVQYVILYICCFIIMITQLEKEDYIFFIRAAEIISFIFVVFIILEIVIPNIFTDYLKFIFPSERRIDLIKGELSKGIYSGISGERAEAAYTANIFIATQICRMFTNKRLDARRIVMTLFGLLALMLTGKRTLLIIPFIALFVLILVNKIKGKYIKIFMIGCVALCAVYFLMLFIPQASVTFNRIFTQSDNVLSGREDLWNVCTEMFKSNPIFGKGLGTFNYYANQDYQIHIVCYQQGIDSWTMEAHNVYYQFLGELGLGGTIPAIGVIAFTFIRTFLLKKLIPIMDNNQKLIYHFSLYIQLWFIVYGFTGNVGHNSQDLIMYFIAVSMYLYLQHTFKNSGSEKQFDNSFGKGFTYENRNGNISESC